LATLFTLTAFVARNGRINEALSVRQADDARRQAQGLPLLTRRRRRRTSIGDLVGSISANAPPN
jgi:hypothetical protein